MKLIVDVPHSLYANLSTIKNESVAGKRILECVKNGTPLKTGQWIPVKTRELTEEEKRKEQWEKAFECPIPEDEQEVLIVNNYGYIEIDRFYNWEGSCCFENNCLDGDVIAWMPLPEPYKAESATETWKGYHRNITAPKGTFDKIFNEADEEDDDI